MGDAQDFVGILAAHLWQCLPIAAARQEGLVTPFLLGGAVVTAAYAEAVGGAYARDSVEAVRVLAELLRREKP